jgi:hypothetical protein
MLSGSVPSCRNSSATLFPLPLWCDSGGGDVLRTAICGAAALVMVPPNVARGMPPHLAPRFLVSRNE